MGIGMGMRTVHYPIFETIRYYTALSNAYLLQGGHLCGCEDGQLPWGYNFAPSDSQVVQGGGFLWLKPP